MATAIIDTLHFRWQLIAPGGEDYAYACWILISVASDIIIFKVMWGGNRFGKTSTYIDACWMLIGGVSDIALFKMLWGKERFDKTWASSNKNISSIAVHNST